MVAPARLAPRRLRAGSRHDDPPPPVVGRPGNDPRRPRVHPRDHRQTDHRAGRVDLGAPGAALVLPRPSPRHSVSLVHPGRDGGRDPAPPYAVAAVLHQLGPCPPPTVLADEQPTAYL